MENFKVTWEVKYYDHEPEIIYYTEELIESKNLESLKDYLDENAMDHSPEMDVPHEDGDFNIEWVLIHDPMESILNTMKMAKKNQKVVTKMERKMVYISIGMKMVK